MNENFLEKEELKKLQDQQNLYSKYIFELGNIELAIENLKNNLKEIEEQKLFLLNDIRSIKDKAEEFQNELVNKYGNIDVNLETGEFINL